MTTVRLQVLLDIFTGCGSSTTALRPGLRRLQSYFVTFDGDSGAGIWHGLSRTRAGVAGTGTRGPAGLPGWIWACIRRQEAGGSCWTAARPSLGCTPRRLLLGGWAVRRARVGGSSLLQAMHLPEPTSPCSSVPDGVSCCAPLQSGSPASLHRSFRSGCWF